MLDEPKASRIYCAHRENFSYLTKSNRYLIHDIIERDLAVVAYTLLLATGQLASGTATSRATGSSYGRGPCRERSRASPGKAAIAVHSSLTSFCSTALGLAGVTPGNRLPHPVLATSPT